MLFSLNILVVSHTQLELYRTIQTIRTKAYIFLRYMIVAVSEPSRTFINDNKRDFDSIFAK